MNTAIAVHELVVEYPGLRALDRVTFALPAGSVTALVGPNGAGKTTLMRCLVALERPFAGAIEVGGIDALQHPREIHRRVGYLSDSFGLYDDLSVARCLEYAAASHGLRGDPLKARVAELVASVDLRPLLERRAGTLSRGERQRVGLAQALAHDPALLVLDEPASGLDPEARHELASLLKRLRDTGKTIIVSSHILAELEDYSNWMLTLDRGQVRGFVPVDRACEAGLRWLQVRLASDPEAARQVAAELTGAQRAEVEADGLLIGWSQGEAAQAELIAHLVGRGVRVVALGPALARMQDVYLSQVGPQRQGGTLEP